VRRHLQFANQIDNLTAIRTACTEVRETGFLRVAVKETGFFELNQNWEANIVAKTRFLICARGVKETGFFR
jgi:hypothetical protein